MVEEVLSEMESSLMLEPLNLNMSDISVPTESTPRSNHVSVVQKKGNWVYYFLNNLVQTLTYV